MKKRLFRVHQIFCILFAILILRTAFIQIVQGSWLQRQAVEQQTRDRMITPARGSILDRNGRPLAVSVSSEIVNVTPNMIAQNATRRTNPIAAEFIAENLAEILDMDEEDVLERLTRSAADVVIKRRVDRREADAVRAFIAEHRIRGVHLAADIRRHYPNNNLASHVIGFVGTDIQGLEGIENIMDAELRGTRGRVVRATDTRGLDMPFGYERLVEPEDGLSVVLTIDERIQQFAERHLEEAYIENRLGAGASTIVMDVRTGEILAMATMPNFNLNDPMTLADERILAEIEELPEEERPARRTAELQRLWRNKAVVDSYEPGSTFKIFTAAMGLEENVVTLNDNFFCGGSMRVADHDIRCWRPGGHGSLDFTRGMTSSCNPMFMIIGARLGLSTFYDYFRGFGFTQTTGIELRGETRGIFHRRNDFKDIDLAISSFGQSFTVTPLQIITSVAAVANDGNMMRPRIIKALQDREGNVVEEFEPEVIRNIVSRETSAALRNVLERTVSEGTGSNAYVSGFRVAGKTGTSEKLPRGNGKYIASFVGFAPADNPVLAVIVILDEPNAGVFYGGVIAAPVAGRILGDSLAYLGIEPQFTAFELETRETAVPDVRGMSIAQARSAIEASGRLGVRVVGSGSEVVSQIPIAGARVNANSIVTINTGGATAAVVVPDVRRMTVAQATAALTNVGLNIRITGAGATQHAVGNAIAFTQSEAAGTLVDSGTVISVEFRTLEVNE